MLTPEEEKKMEDIRRRLREGHPDDPADPADRAFLIGLLDRLLREKPDDFQFPPYLALVNDVNRVAYAMRLDRRMRREQVFGIGQVAPGSPDNHFLETTECEIYEAELLARPYVRPLDCSPSVLEELSRGTLTLEVDAYKVLDRFPVRDFLVGPDGYGVRRRPFSFSGFLSTAGEFFRACALERVDPNAQTYQGQAVLTTNATAVSDNNGYIANGAVEYGLMLTRQSVIDIRVEGIHDRREPLRIAVGAVAAVYSTKHKILRKQDWSPRTHEAAAGP